MAVAIVLPARLASTRLPGKLLLDRTGRTVLEHTVGQALTAFKRHPRLFRTILVACDDERLAVAARRGGAEAVLTRPDHRSGTDRIVEAIRKTHLKEEIIVNLQADEPEIAPENLYRVAKLLANAPRAVPMATLAVLIHDEEIWRRPNVVKVVTDASGDGAGRALYFSRAPIPFIRDANAPPPRTVKDPGGASRPVLGLHHLGIYAYRRPFLLGFPKLPPSPLEETEKLEQLRVLEAGYDILVGLAEANPPGVDTPEEYEAFVQRQGIGGRERRTATADGNGERRRG